MIFMTIAVYRNIKNLMITDSVAKICKGELLISDGIKRSVMILSVGSSIWSSVEQMVELSLCISPINNIWRFKKQLNVNVSMRVFTNAKLQCFLYV